MQRTILMAKTRRVVLAVTAVLGLTTVLAGCIPDQPNLKNAYLVNTERMAHGLRPYGWDDELAAKARSWAQQMAEADSVSHSVLTEGVSPGWEVLGENVGAGATIDSVHAAFMASPEHRRVILSGSYHTMGIGVAEHDGEYWVVEVYKG